MFFHFIGQKLNFEHTHFGSVSVARFGFTPKNVQRKLGHPGYHFSSNRYISMLLLLISIKILKAGTFFDQESL